MKNCGIYKIINKVNGKYYVGSSTNIDGTDGRWYKHINSLTHNRHHNDYLQSAWNKYGQSNFDFIIIESINENATKKEILKIEQKYLDIAHAEEDKCYNLNFDAQGGKLSEYSKRKIGRKSKGRKSILGKNHTEEHKQKISILMSGKNNHRYGKPGVNLGRKWSLETKIKMSNPNIYCFFNVNTEEKFVGSMYQLRLKYNDLNPSALISVVKGIRKSHHKWKLL